MIKAFIDKKLVEKIRSSFPAGTRIELIRMGEDPEKEHYPPGSSGKVTSVDDLGTIHMRWDSGGSLGLIVGEDLFRIIEEDK